MLVERTFVSDALGAVRIIGTDRGLVAIYFAEHRRPRVLETRVLGPDERHAVLDRATHELTEYLRGVRRSFSVPLAPDGTPFQRAVWTELTAIPFGETRSYAQLAGAVGRPRAVRAVGAANALNPLSVIVPCHRVIGSNGALTGYAGGVDRKRWLLDHESRAGRTRLSRLA
jgi:methylated-DNA-[protein]-cysteine S-methyltransferase